MKYPRYGPGTGKDFLTTVIIPRSARWQNLVSRRTLTKQPLMRKRSSEWPNVRSISSYLGKWRKWNQKCRDLHPSMTCWRPDLIRGYFSIFSVPWWWRCKGNFHLKTRTGQPRSRSPKDKDDQNDSKSVSQSNRLLRYFGTMPITTVLIIFRWWGLGVPWIDPVLN